MRTKFLSLEVKCVLAAAAALVGCNAILDNQEGHLVASESGGTAGSSSVGGHSGTSGGSAAVAGSTSGGKSSVGGNTPVGGNGTTQGGTQAGGGTNVGGAQATGGASTPGGTASTSNINAAGGATTVGGNTASGGVKATGGVTAGTAVTGGTTTIGTTAVGGATATGGKSGTGGSSTNGGTPPTGGTKSTGGAPSATGGAVPTGGTKSTGGAPATGGAATGGTSAVVGPSVVFSFASVNDGATTNLTTATFGFSSTPAGAASSYLCKFNAATTFTDCTASLSLSQLSAGGQVLTVHALNSQGIAGPDATRSWTIAALSTTIKNIRTLGTPTDTLVAVTTNVRVTGFGTQGGQQVIFVQEAGPAASLVVDTAADIAGSPVLNAGILTRALTTQTARAEGTPVTVTGTVSMNGQSLELARSSYIWGTGTVTPYNIPEVRTSTVYASTLEGVRIGLAGQIPSFNCSSSCFNAQIGNSGNLCIETTCMDTGCGTNKILAWLDITGGATPPVTSGYGIWNGWLVKRSSYYELWTNSSDSFGNDLCL